MKPTTNKKLLNWQEIRLQDLKDLMEGCKILLIQPPKEGLEGMIIYLRSDNGLLFAIKKEKTEEGKIKASLAFIP